MKVSALNKDAHRRYKVPILTQNIVSLPVISYNGCTIILDGTSIKVTKSRNQVMEGYREQHTKLWILKLEDVPR